MKTKYKLMLSGATTACLFMSMPGFAQEADAPAPAADEDSVATMDTVTVNARKRDEALTDVPVSISVLDTALIQDAGIVTQQDLFELVPGIYYEEAFDRNSALPSVRGVQANEVATLRTKVTQFIDGMPVLGSQGNAPFGDAAQVEVYRGPQSAAFGRSTFAGAINYVTKDPGDEIEASANVDINDYGRFMYGATVSGPITDTLGFLLSANIEDTSGPDEYIATDGTPYGERSSEAFGAKLVWTPTENFTAKLSYSSVESDDAPSPEIFLSQAARDECYAAGGSFSIANMGTVPYANGEIDCDWDQGGPIPAQNDRAALMIANGETDEDRLFLASAQSIPADQVGAYDERERLALNLAYDFDNGHAIEFSGFVGEEYYVRHNDGSLDAVNEIAITPAMGVMGAPAAFPWTVATMGMDATLGAIMSDPSDIEEQYAEIRWISPEEDRLRYVVGASYYDYSFLTNLYFGGYGAILQGEDAVARYLALTGTDISVPEQVFAEEATTTGAFFNLTYDVTEKLTASFEGRYQIDEVGGKDSISGIGGTSTTEAFLPRASFNYDVSDSLTMYGQIARGNNPSGVNVGFFNPDNAAQLDCTDTIASGILGPNGESFCGQNYVDYTSEDLQFYEEETLTNYELGFKGTLFDDRLNFSTAVYYLDWQDQTQSINLNWNDPNVGGAPASDTTNRTTLNLGDIESKGLEFEGTLRVTDGLRIRGTAAIQDTTYADLCDFTVVGGGLDTDPSQLSSGIAGECYNVTGNKVRGQPVFAGSLSPSYVTALGNSGFDFTTRADIRYEDGRYLDTVNVGKTVSVTTVNVTAGISNDNWNIVGYINNLTEVDTPQRFGGGEDYSITGDTTGLGINNYLYTPRQPRTVGLRLRYTY